MKDMPMSEDTEHAALENIEAQMVAAKAALRSIIKSARAMKEINEAAGRGREANAAFGFMGKARRLLADVEVTHAEGTDLLWEYWPDHAAEFASRSGHR